MTGKRFEYKNHKVFDNLTGEEHSSNMVSVNVLNQLAEENEQLKHDATVLIYSNQEYRKENEQLKEEIKDLNDILARYEERELKE